jgi:hypothetical protein
MFLEEASVRYVYKDFPAGVKPTIDDVRALNATWDEEYAEAPFCNAGDFDIDDLKAETPDSWSFDEIGQLDEGQCRIAIVAINYNGERQINLQEEAVTIDVFNLCGLSVLSGGEKHEEIFGEEWYSDEPFGDKAVLFMNKYPNLNCDSEVFEASLDEIDAHFDEWLDCVENPPSQGDLESKAALLKSLFG